MWSLTRRWGCRAPPRRSRGSVQVPLDSPEQKWKNKNKTQFRTMVYIWTIHKISYVDPDTGIQIRIQDIYFIVSAEKCLTYSTKEAKVGNFHVFLKIYVAVVDPAIRSGSSRIRIRNTIYRYVYCMALNI